MSFVPPNPQVDMHEASLWALCVAPMLAWTDRHCRYFHRLLAPSARLYTEMITTGALRHGDVEGHLHFDPAEHPVAFQVGGCEPAELAHAAKLAERWGYDEINLNCGCPADRAQKGAFGACLMAEPSLVADGVRAMRDAVSVPVTVKHRIGLDYNESYGFVRDFVGEIHEAGCNLFIVHARNAVLKGLSPKENRTVPPLRYEVVRQLQRDFPELHFVLNGGLANREQALAEWQGHAVSPPAPQLAGVMIGREAWHRPQVLRELSEAMWPHLPLADDDQVIADMHAYCVREVARGVPLRNMVLPLLGFANGLRGARRWRQLLSDAGELSANDPDLLWRAWEAVEPGQRSPGVGSSERPHSPATSQAARAGHPQTP